MFLNPLNLFLPFALKSAELLLNQTLRLEPSILVQLESLDNKKIEIHLLGLELSFFISIEEAGVFLLTEHPQEVNVRLIGAPFSLLHLLMNKNVNLVANPDIQVFGEVAVLQKFSEIMQELHLDWESYLAHWMGDAAAFQVGNAVGQTQEYFNTQSQHWQRTFVEYWQEEAKYLPNPLEANEFIQQIDVLRDDVERFEIRLQRLLKKHLE